MILEAKQISKWFYEPQRLQVLKDIDLAVEAGELISIFGESGSGKSTLLYILASLDIDFEGDLTIQGQTLKNLSDEDLSDLRNRHLGFVYQSHYLLPEFNVLQNVLLPAMKQTGTKLEVKRKMALDLLEEIGLKSLAERPAFKLSGGQQQRTAIARALINDPALIIADEPTGNLDQKNSKIVFDLLKDIAENRGKSVIIATHSQTLMKNSHRAIEMIDGRLRL